MISPARNRTLWTRILDLPLRYRLILPFFLLAFLGTFALVWVAILSQNKLISQQERRRLFEHYQTFLYSLDVRGRWAASLASTFARNPQVAEALAQRDRLRVIKLCYPAYIFMKKNYDIHQFHFGVPPGRSFLRLHRLYDFNDALWGTRGEVVDALRRNREVHGLEKGLTGYSVRGVVPVVWKGRTVGSIEIGFGFGPLFLKEMKERSDVDFSVLIRDSQKAHGFVPLSSTRPWRLRISEEFYDDVYRSGLVKVTTRNFDNRSFAILVGPLRDYKGKTIGVVELGVNRSKTLRLINQYRRWMLGLGIIGMLLSAWAIYVISYFFTRPIARMVALAREISLGKKVQRIESRPSGELGQLADALNEMLASLERSREQIKEYAENLEQRVHLRTRALRESEEKYRTLVESLPLVVYRVVEGGKTIFVNSFVEELTGVSVAEAMADDNFWKEKVHEDDRERVWPLMDRCLEQGRELKIEYRIRHRNGKILYVFDHAVPVLDEKGQVEIIDGILVNVSDRYRLQQQIIQTEELRTLSQISARLAHEIRNPLAIAGGFARRLLHKLPETDPNRTKVEIILKEIARLEKLLEKSIAYLKPFDLVPVRASLNELVQDLAFEQRAVFEEHGVDWQLEFANNIEPVMIDKALFRKALDAVVRSLLTYCRAGESSMWLRTFPGENSVNLEMIVSSVRASEDDIEHFFYPFTSGLDEELALDLPVAKMIIHRHRGLVQLRKRSSGELVFTLSLPLS